MNFDLSEDQRLLYDTVGAFVKKSSPVSRFRALRQDPLGWDPKVWRTMGEQGWIGAAFPEEAGGLGASFVEAALILEQLGTTLVPEPYLPTLVAGMALVDAGTPDQRRRFLLPALEGKISLALATSETGSRWGAGAPQARVESGKLFGNKRWVRNGHAAEAIVVSARDGLYLVERGAPGLDVRSVKTIDGQRAAMLRFEGCPAEPLAGGNAAAAFQAALDVGAAGCCAEGYGIMRTVLAMTVDYLRTREQFGVKIGTFQALQHRAVDMFVETELARSTAILAAIRARDADVPTRQSAISAAKVQLAMGGKYVTQQAIQLHGGIGVTDEHDVGLYFKRMHVLNSMFGDEEHHVERFARLPAFTA
jgi:alkylation response protein AidB-like acyl-CoA dehydrogenase